MNRLSILQIAEFADASVSSGDGKVLVEKVSTDSRTLKRGDLFVALRGENFDGHKFVEAAAKAGAAGAIVDLDWKGKVPESFAVIRVERYFARLSKSGGELSKIASAQSARHHRQQRQNEHEGFCRGGSR